MRDARLCMDFVGVHTNFKAGGAETSGFCRSLGTVSYTHLRGADFESGNLIARAKAMIPLLVPLFVSSFRRANELAMAMDCLLYTSRCV